MKHILAFVLFLFLLSSVSAQKIYTRKDSILVTQDSILLKAGPYRGNIQWQKSLDSKNWINLEGEIKDSLKVKTDTEALYRAKVVEGTCLPSFSDTAQIKFTLPIVTTLPVTEINAFSATLGGNIINNGGVPLTDWGVCYSLIHTPTISDAKVSLCDQVGTFSNTITELSSNTTYYVRAFATNMSGTAYGEQKEFRTNPLLLFTGSQTIIASQGGSIISTEGTVLKIPENSLPINGDVSIDITENESSIVANPNYQVVGNSYSISFPTDSLLNKVQLSFDLPELSVPLENYSLYLYNGNSYYPIEYSIDNDRVTAIIDIIHWETIQTLKSNRSVKFHHSFWGDFVVVQIINKQKPPVEEMGLKEYDFGNGKLINPEPISDVHSKVLLLIHGWTGNSTTWDSFISWIKEENDPYFSKVWIFSYNSSKSVIENSTLLSTYLAQYANGIKVDIVSHSMGGLLARHMIEYGNGSQFVNKLVTLGTPHLGSSLAALRLVIGLGVTVDDPLNAYNYFVNTQGFNDLNVNSDLINLLKKTNQPPLPYCLIAASNNPGWYYLPSKEDLLPGLDDGVVTVASALGVPGCTTPTPIPILVDIAHLKMTHDKYIYLRVLKYLREELPTIATVQVSNVTSTSAISGGNIIFHGGSPITACGVYWNNSGNAILDGPKTNDGNGTGSFISILTNLKANTTYQVQAYATNSTGTAYGEPITFTTPGALPEVSTGNETNTTQTSTFLNGDVTSDGGAAITERGFYCSKSENLLTENATKILVNGTTGSFSTQITQLQANTRYYFCAFARNSQGEKTGEIRSFTTLPDANLKGTFTDPRDGKTYQWVKVGDQTWMAENLAYRPSATPTNFNSSTEPCYYDYDVNTLGALYNWPAAACACPSEWHLPTNAEWDTFTDNLGNDPAALLSNGLGGYHYYDHFSQTRVEGHWWTSTSYNASNAYKRRFFPGISGLSSDAYEKQIGYSVRCVKGVVLPTVSTRNMTDITQTTAVLGGDVTSDGGASITEKGFYCSKSENLLTENATKILVNGTTGSFSTQITQLQANTRYYFCAFARNSQGEKTGEIRSFTTLPDANLKGTFTDSRDGKTYQWVKIGNQTWMAENLAYDTGNGSWAFNNDAGNLATFGRLYTWDAAWMAVPNGWHLPSNEEWNQLAQYISDAKGPFATDGNQWESVGGYLKSTSGWNNGGNGTDDFGFNGLPAQGWNTNQTGEYAGWWSSDEIYAGSLQAFHRFLYCEHNAFNLTTHPKENGYSVRCIKDDVTSAVVPTLRTTPASSITYTSAISGGTITSNGGAPVIASGVCWSTSPNPTTGDLKTTGESGMGNFTAPMSDLTANTTYYVRAYATNSVGTAYGNEVSFKTPEAVNETGTFTDSRDNHVYQWVKIGNQTWMAENLAYIPSKTPVDVSSATDPCYYDFDASVYGVLYNWPAAACACPSEWHLPSDSEWKTLEDFLISNGYNYDHTTSGNKIAKSLASTSGWFYNTGITYLEGAISNDPSSNNRTGFSALPGGYYINKSFYMVSNIGYWWTATEEVAPNIWVRTLGHYLVNLNSGPGNKELGMSVRCLKN